MPGGKPRRAVILTAIEVEYEAVCAHLTNLRRDSRGRVHYYRGTFSTTNRVWDVVIRQTGSGNVRAAVETLLAIHYFHPTLILFVGVAGGLKDVTLGDVVIPTKVYTYESGRANVTSYQTRPDVVKPTFSLVQLAQAEAKETDWLQRLREPTPDTVPSTLSQALPHVLAAPIASGESVVASTRSAIWKFLRTNYSDAVAVDMESFGFLLAAYYHPDVEALVIRGISDRINNKKRTDRDNFQVFAAHHASAFSFEILAKVDGADLRRSRHRVETRDEPAVPSDYAALTPPKPVAGPLPEPEMASTTSMHSQEFLKQIQRYKDEIREMHDLFGEGRVTFYDQCRRAIQLTIDIELLISRYDGYIPLHDRHIELRIINILDQTEDLRFELYSFPHIYSSEKQGPHQKKIRDKLASLLENLEQIVKES